MCVCSFIYFWLCTGGKRYGNNGRGGGNLGQGKAKDKDKLYRLQVYVEDCQGCDVCVVECPTDALTMVPIEEERDKS